MKSDNSFENVLVKEALNIGIELSSKQTERFKKYKELLVEWNEKMNLTAITEDYQVVMKHFIDCLEIVKHINKGERIIDVGTGAGFPGLVIAIFFDNEIDITLIDSLNKRVSFLEEVIKELNLKKVQLIHGRAEEYSHKKEYRSAYDVVVSRAVAPLNILIEYDIPYLKVNGRALLLKGNNVFEEIKESNNALQVLKSEIVNIFNYEYCVDDEIYKRNIIEIIKKEQTISKYPRNYGKLKKNPL